MRLWCLIYRERWKLLFAGWKSLCWVGHFHKLLFLKEYPMLEGRNVLGSSQSSRMSSNSMSASWRGGLQMLSRSLSGHRPHKDHFDQHVAVPLIAARRFVFDVLFPIGTALLV